MAKVSVRTGKLVIDFRYKNVRCREQTNLADTDFNRTKLEITAKKIESAIRQDLFYYPDFFPNSKKCQHFAELPRPSKDLALNEFSPLKLENNPTFTECAFQWLEDNKTTWKESHFTSIKNVITKHVLEFFGQYHLEEVTRQSILDFRQELLTSKPRQTAINADWANHIMVPLRRIIIEATARNGLPNPYTNIDPLPTSKNPINPLTVNEVTRFLKNVADEFLIYYMMRFFTGLRPAEIDGLKWQQVNLRLGKIEIPTSETDSSTLTFDNEISYRPVHIPKILIELLIDHQVQSGSLGYVFCFNDGSPFDQATLNRLIWEPTLRKIKVTKRRQFETRHTAARLWLEAGESVDWVSQQLGYINSKTVFETYSQYIPKQTSLCGAAFESMLSKHVLKFEKITDF